MATFCKKKIGCLNVTLPVVKIKRKTDLTDEREREREIQRHRETYRERERDRDTERETDTDRDTQRNRKRDRDTKRERERERERERKQSLIEKGEIKSLAPLTLGLASPNKGASAGSA